MLFSLFVVSLSVLFVDVVAIVVVVVVVIADRCCRR